MKKGIYAAAAVFLLLVVGCDTMTGPESGQSADQNGRAAVSLAITGTGGRSVLPKAPAVKDVAKWRLRGVKTGESEKWLTGFFADYANEILYLETGEWDFTLEGYTDESDETLILRGAIEDQAITLGDLNTLEFTVAPISEEGTTGTVRITINLPPGHGINRVDVFKDGAKFEPDPPLTPVVNSIVFEQIDHKAGDFYYSFQLWKDPTVGMDPSELYGVVSELISVRQNLTSEETYDLNPEDLNLSYAITYELNDEGESTGDLSPASYRYTESVTLPTMLTWPGHEFKGWYEENNQFGGEAVLGIPAGSATEDKTFYANWRKFSSATAITGFSVNVVGEAVEIGDGTVTVTVPPGTDLTTLTPAITVSDYATVYPESGTLQDFTNPVTNPVTYTVTAEDHSRTTWIVTVEAVLPSVDAITNYLSTAEEPVTLPVKINLASDWSNLLSAINTVDKTVALDLSKCDITDMTGTPGEFDPGAGSIGVSKIVSLVLPNAAESVKAGTGENNATFKNFTALKSVTGSKVITIGDNAFAKCSALTEASFPLAETIGLRAFHTTALETISLPAAITIKNDAFWGCSALRTVESTATTIGVAAFQNCSALETVTLPKAETIDESAFRNCTKLQELSLPAAITIGSDAFNGCKALTTINLPEAITIVKYAFYNCAALETVYLPEAETIGEAAFRDCTKLQELSLLATTIDTDAFNGCKALTTINLTGATTFGDRVFYNTGGTALIITLGSTIPKLGNNTFGYAGYKSVTVNVPTAVEEDYDTTWINQLKNGNTGLTVYIDTY